MTNSTEIEIGLNGEALEYVPEYTYLGQLISLLDNSGKETKRIEMAWNKFKNLGFILADKYQKRVTKEDVLESCVFPVLLYGVKHGRSRKRKRGYSKLVSGRWNGEYCKLYGATK
jgi:hypothetical protein